MIAKTVISSPLNGNIAKLLEIPSKEIKGNEHEAQPDDNAPPKIPKKLNKPPFPADDVDLNL